MFKAHYQVLKKAIKGVENIFVKKNTTTTHPQTHTHTPLFMKSTRLRYEKNLKGMFNGCKNFLSTSESF